jgi:hypothetical protein
MYEENRPENLEHLVKECPLCQEFILEIAIKCRHCGEMLEDYSIPSMTPFDKPHYTSKENYLHKSWSKISQFLAILLIIVGFLGINTIYWPLIMFPLGIAFWMFGAIGARWEKCSNCGCAIANKQVSKCSRCYFEFSKSS